MQPANSTQAIDKMTGGKMTIDKIVFPTDFSPSAESALETAALLARTFGAQLDLFNAVVLDVPYLATVQEASAGRSRDLLLDEMAAQGRRALEEIARSLEPLSPAVTTSLERGESEADTVLEHADSEKADLIVMSSHGRRGFRRFLMGSVTEEIVRRSSCPVLVVRRDPDVESPVSLDEGVLAAIDFGPGSEQVTNAARSLADQLDRRLELLHVSPPPSPLPTVTAVGPQSQADIRGTGAGMSLDEARRRLIALEAAASETQVRAGDPAECILDRAEEGGCGFIVMGTAGREGISRFLLGSVCEKVMRRAPCPVLVMPVDTAEDTAAAHPGDQVLGTSMVQPAVG